MQAMIAAGRGLVLLRGISDRELRDVEHAVRQARGQLVTESGNATALPALWLAYLRAPGCNTCSCAVAWRLWARPCRWRPRCGSTCNGASTRQNSCARWSSAWTRTPSALPSRAGFGLLRPSYSLPWRDAGPGNAHPAVCVMHRTRIFPPVEWGWYGILALRSGCRFSFSSIMSKAR